VAGPGDFIDVPPFLPHQEINASNTAPLSCVLCRSGQQPAPRCAWISAARRPSSAIRCRDSPARRAATTHRSAQLEAEWRALRNLSLKASLQSYRQSSSDPAGNFHGSQLTAGASLLF
jgi:hypothetical protein